MIKYLLSTLKIIQSYELSLAMNTSLDYDFFSLKLGLLAKATIIGVKTCISTRTQFKIMSEHSDFASGPIGALCRFALPNLNLEYLLACL